MAKKTAVPAAAPQSDVDEYPKTKYKKCAKNSRRPDGYEARQVGDADAEAALGKDWVDSPEDL